MSSTGPGPGDIADVRYQNVLVLFDEFVRQNVRNADAAMLRGLERRFAEHVLIQPSYWSQIKSRTRQIGERLARQFEQRCRKPIGWLDVMHGESPAAMALPPTASADEPSPTSSAPRDDDERFIVGLVLTYYRRHPKRARQRLLDLLGEVLTTPPPTETPPPPPPSPDDDHAAWLQSQRGVAPLKKRPR